MSLNLLGFSKRATPVVNGDFVVVEIDGTGAHKALITDVLDEIDDITKTYPARIVGLLIGNTSGATMHIGTTNTGAPAPATDGIPIAADQSLYLPIVSIGTDVTYKAANTTKVCVAVFF
jgi:hypothetical protein